MTKDQPYRLSEDEREALRWAKVGFLSGALSLDLKAVREGKRSNPAEKLDEIRFVDDRYDGRENRSKVITLVPTHPVNILLALCQEKYGYPFGQILFSFLIFNIGCSYRTADKWTSLKMKEDFGNVDFGGPIRRPSAREIADATEAASDVESGGRLGEDRP